MGQHRPPLPGVTVDLVDRTGTVVDSPGTGEMRIAGRPGETLAAGYWHDLQATEETFTDQGLRTGDLARRDSDGFLYFVDRAKEMIKRSGENVSAGEIERVAESIPLPPSAPPSVSLTRSGTRRSCWSPSCVPVTG